MRFRTLFLFTLLMGCSIKKSDELVTANIVNPNDLRKITRFRSCCGHDYSGGAETNRNMKHYLIPQSSFGISNTSLSVYAPFDGLIVAIRGEEHQISCFNDRQGSQIDIVPYARPDMKVKLFHVNPQVSKGPVRSGERIAYADLRGCDGSGGTASQASFDVSVEFNGLKESYFEFLSGGLLQVWIDRGLPSKSAAIISKEARDASACTQFASTQCNSEEVVFP